MGTVWDDRLGNPVSDFVYQNGVTATPLAPARPLAALTGEQANGTWRLRVDDKEDGDAGVLKAWTIKVYTGSCSMNPPAPSGFAPPVVTTVASTTPLPVPAAGTATGTVTSTIAVSGAGSICGTSTSPRTSTTPIPAIST